MSQKQEDWSRAVEAKITEDHIERARLLLGHDEPQKIRQPFTTATADQIRMFAFGYGSDNPLHADPDYAANTRWGGVVAPGLMSFLMGERLRGDPLPEALARAKKSLFQRIHQMHSGTDWRFYRPIRPGDTIYGFRAEESLEVKQSEFAGTSVVRVGRMVRMNQDAQVVAVERMLMVLSERDAAAKRGKYMAVQPAVYTDAELAALDEIYAAETVRGAEPRYWEDVEVGESLGVMAKGPLTLTDIILFHMNGYGIYPFGPVTGKLKWQRRQTMPAAFVKNGQGVPDIVMRMHWDDEWARALGSPMAYDYGYQRECWVSHYLTNWCGDDGLVHGMKVDMRKMNYLGDTQTITGEVVAKTPAASGGTVEVEVKSVSQRGQVTLTARATIGLPSRERGLPDYPEPPAELAEKARRFMARHRELGGA
jgi:acyl dehydratase